MKKIFMMLLVLFLIYLGMQVGYSFFGTGHTEEYLVTTNDKNFVVKETFSNKSNDIKSYFFEIKYDNENFYYQTSHDFKKSKQIIKNIYQYKDSLYNCIFPIFENNQIISDVLCKKNNIVYNYHNIIGNDKKLDEYVKELEDVGYNQNLFIDTSNVLSKEQLNIYENNVLNNVYYGLTNYKGLYLINYATGGKVKGVELFDKDVYKRPLSIFFKKYYVVADYNKDYRFDTFYVVDVTNSKIKEIKIGKEVSFDGYIQGTNDNSIYFFDKNYKIQYEINLTTNKVIEVGNEKTGIKILKNGDWTRIPASQAINGQITFGTENDDLFGFAKVDKIGIDSGYYYLYDKSNNIFNVYRSDIQNKEQSIYLFESSDMNRVLYENEYVYYISDDCLKYYNDKIGERKLVCYNELKYNDSLIFGVYSGH